MRCAAKIFTDVSADAWYHNEIDYVIFMGYMNGNAEGIVQGYNNKLSPTVHATRAEIATMLYRYTK